MARKPHIAEHANYKVVVDLGGGKTISSEPRRMTAATMLRTALDLAVEGSGIENLGFGDLREEGEQGAYMYENSDVVVVNYMLCLDHN